MSVHLPPISDVATRTLVLRHVAALIARVQAFFVQHQDAQLKRFCAHFFDQVDGRPHSTQAQNLRTAALVLEQQGDVFNRALQAALRESIEEEVEAVMPGALHSLRTGQQSGDPTGPNSMALLDVDEIERHLLVDRVAQRFNARYEPKLVPLTQSVGALLQLEDFSLVDNPFRPASLIRAFLLAWYNGGFDPLAAEDFVSAIEPRVSVDWDPMYADLTAALVRAGYSSKPVHRIKRTSGGESGHAPPRAERESGVATRSDFGASEHAGVGAASAAKEPGLGQTIATRARQFLQQLGFGAADTLAGSEGSGLTGGGGAGPSSAQGRVTQAPADAGLMGFLGGLQARAFGSQFPSWADGQDIAGQNVLRQMREREEVQRAPELDRGTVDALAEVFDYVFADKAIPMPLKYVIGRLQIPVLKAAIIDRAFFLSSEHPARRLVDALAAAAVGWSPEKGEADPLYMAIDGVVKRVLAEFENDLQLFQILLAGFAEFLQDNEQHAQAQIAPTAQQVQQQEALELALVHADEVVHQCIHALPASAPLLPFLLPFLTTQWREVLARAWVALDAQPKGWDDAARSMDELIWSTNPKPLADERARLTALLPDLVRRLDASLDAIGWAGEERAAFMRRLIAAHMRAIRIPKAGLAAVDSGPGELEVAAGRDAIRALDQRLATQAEPQVDQFDAMAHALERGQWFDFEGQGERALRYRLTWVSPQRSRLLFTNREGFEAFVHSEREVAGLLRQGRLSVIVHDPIVARAIEQIMIGGETPGPDLQLA